MSAKPQRLNLRKRNLRKRNLPGHTNQFVQVMVVTVSLFVLTLATAWFVRAPDVPTAVARIAAPAATGPAEKYLGTVQLAPDQEGRCEQFEIDNRAGVLKSKGPAKCNDVTAATTTTTGRRVPGGALQGVGGYFRSH